MIYYALGFEGQESVVVWTSFDYLSRYWHPLFGELRVHNKRSLYGIT
jgi:hypothetical protein